MRSDTGPLKYRLKTNNLTENRPLAANCDGHVALRDLNLLFHFSDQASPWLWV
jgi:hypothetical protein